MPNKIQVAKGDQVIPIILKVPTSHNQFGSVLDCINGSLVDRGLTAHFFRITMSAADLFEIYSHLSQEILTAQIAQFADKEIGSWIVTGRNAIAKVTEMKGSENDPRLCSPSSWRRRLSVILGFRQIELISTNGRPLLTMFDNYIHAPKRAEIDLNLRFFRRQGHI